MTGKGTIASRPNRRLRLVVGLHFLWLFVVSLLGAWWTRLALKLAGRVAELEGTYTELNRTKRMITWEAGTFYLLLIATSALLIWLYWRDSRRSRSLQAFFASVTHELRTPLTSIRLQAESIAESSGHTPLVERLLEDTVRLESQVNRTLELARVEGGGALYVQPLPIRPWMERLIKNWEETYGERIRFETKLDTSVVESDPSALDVILRNLLENSIRHSQQKEKLRIAISSESRGRSVLVRFQDNGSGYEGDARKLGEIFHKGAGSHGAGVGLYLIRMLMERMGGEASFLSGSDGFRAELRFAGRDEERAHG